MCLCLFFPFSSLSLLTLSCKRNRTLSRGDCSTKFKKTATKKKNPTPLIFEPAPVLFLKLIKQVKKFWCVLLVCIYFFFPTFLPADHRWKFAFTVSSELLFSPNKITPEILCPYMRQLHPLQSLQMLNICRFLARNKDVVASNTHTQKKPSQI